MTRFWVRIFGLTFAIGVATGIVMEFQFGTNWAAYSRFVGDVFGSALAAEGIFAFFLESGFLAVLLFGWDKVGPRHALLRDADGLPRARTSAPSGSSSPTRGCRRRPGYHIVDRRAGRRARRSPTSGRSSSTRPRVDRLTHTILGAWQAGAFLVMCVGAFYLLRGTFIEIRRRRSLRVGLVFALVASLGSLVTGHRGARRRQSRISPTKLAAMEAHYPASAPADLYLFGWVDEQRETVVGIALPGMLSWMLHGDRSAPVQGLLACPARRPTAGPTGLPGLPR